MLKSESWADLIGPSLIRTLSDSPWYGNSKIKKTKLYQKYRALLSRQKSLQAQVEINKEEVYEFEQKHMKEIIGG